MRKLVDVSLLTYFSQLDVLAGLTNTIWPAHTF